LQQLILKTDFFFFADQFGCAQANFYEFRLYLHLHLGGMKGETFTCEFSKAVSKKSFALTKIGALEVHRLA